MENDSNITRRSAFALVGLLPFSLSNIQSSRILASHNVSRKIEVKTVNGKPRWKFQFIRVGGEGNPLAIGECVYFDGRSFGAPTIEGKVIEITQDHPLIQDVIVVKE